MKTAFIITDLKQGGIETYLLRFLSLYKDEIELLSDKAIDYGSYKGKVSQWIRLHPDFTIEEADKELERLNLDIDYVKSCKGLLPASKFAVDAYVNFVGSRSLLEAIASSLTEIYAPAIHAERISGLSKHYEWADDYALAYFKKRIGQARKDVEFGRE